MVDIEGKILWRKGGKYRSEVALVFFFSFFISLDVGILRNDVYVFFMRRIKEGLYINGIYFLSSKEV